MTAPARFTQADVRRAFKSVDGLGYEEVRVTVSPSGEIAITARRNANDDESEGQELD